MERITQFRDKYAFLSNFYSAPVYYQGIRFENNEAAFQAAKCPGRMREFCKLSAPDAKRLGRRVSLRPDWETVKFNIMDQICKAKFLQNPDLAWKLVETGSAGLIEGNTWGDKIWGVCNGIGEDHLGLILMDIRDDLNLSLHCPTAPCTMKSADVTKADAAGGPGIFPAANATVSAAAIAPNTCPPSETGKEKATWIITLCVKASMRKLPTEPWKFCPNLGLIFWSSITMTARKSTST